ncbi:unnamed protein product [Rhizoctonia solani]|uniref:BTB domain-containing protein n=1 Tax=Rhizoctonia solani TaxID=456999 RepID=A0A8H3B8G9_9AGAM|nr:unnamed protein product [Rhizoctonia solani]
MAKKKSAALTTRAGSVVFVGNASDTKSHDNPDETSSTEAPEEVMPHPQFFLDNTLIAIQIEKTLFNVHKYQLAKSEFFSDMFKEPKAEEGEPEAGSSPKNPIVIKGVSALDFAALLKVLYASHFSGEQHIPETPLIIPAFRLANLFNFPELRAYLLPLAEQNLSEVDKIIFAREFDIKEWLAPSHIHLCQRLEPPDVEEARKLGVDSVRMISRMREKYRTKGSSAVVGGFYCYSCAGMTHHGSGNSCRQCGSGSGYLRCDGLGKIPAARVDIDYAAIEAEVTKWVEDGCDAKD